MFYLKVLYPIENLLFIFIRHFFDDHPHSVPMFAYSVDKEN